METSYKKLIAYQKARQLIVGIYKITNKYPSHELYNLTSQTRRSAVSIAANIVEGYTKKSTKEYLRFLDIAIGSAAETEVHLDIAHELGYISDSNFAKINDLLSEVKKLLYTYIKSLRARG